MPHVSFPFFSAIYGCFDYVFDMLLSDKIFEIVWSSWVTDIQKFIRIDFLYFHASTLKR